MPSEWRIPGCPEPPEWRVDIGALRAMYPWLEPLSECPQDPIFHAEGDVFTHLGMVLTELASLAAFRELSELDRHIVFAGTPLIWLLNAMASTIRGTGNMLVPSAAVCVAVALAASLSAAGSLPIATSCSAAAAAVRAAARLSVLSSVSLAGRLSGRRKRTHQPRAPDGWITQRRPVLPSATS